jgi:hypothetical protein
MTGGPSYMVTTPGRLTAGNISRFGQAGHAMPNGKG